MNTTAPAHGPAIEIEVRAADVHQISQSITALAVLMSAADQGQTEGYLDTSIFHGLGYVFETLGTQLRGHVDTIARCAGDLIQSRGAAPQEAATAPPVQLCGECLTNVAIISARLNHPEYAKPAG